jgi:hypothetical protein
MMDYYSYYPGPSKSGALEQIKTNITASLLAENHDFIENDKREDLERLINESITEGVDQVYGDSDECPGSATGWAVFVRPDILRETRRILGEKTRQYKRDILEKAKKKVVSKQLIPQKINLDDDTNKGLADKISSMTKGGKRKTNKKHKQRKKKTKKRPRKKQKKTRKQKRYKN